MYSMSYRLKTGQFAVKDENGDYIGFDVMADQTKEQLINEIQTAGNAQQQAIQTKGEETLESIPADYTALSEDVSDLNQYIKNVANLEYVTVTE